MTGPGTTIAGRYDLIGRLGAGAMGSVWLARDTSLNRDVAVKSVHGPLVDGQSDSVEGEQRAMREARMIARVNHPHAVAIYDVVKHEDDVWLVVEYVPSQNLAQVVDEAGPISAHRAAEFGSQVAAALAEAHRAGIVHRDVKPANVLVSDQGAAKITDFGVARGDGDVTLTATGMVWGTPAYFAPEVARGENPTSKADVWSLGATLYFAVEGKPPHGTESSPLVLLGRIANEPVPRPDRAGALTPVLARLLERDPDSRPTMTEAAELLSSVARPTTGEHPATATVPPAAPSVPPAPREHGDGRRRRSGVLLAALAAAALVAVGALAWSLLDLGGDDARTTAGGSEPTAPAQPRSPSEGGQSPEPSEGGQPEPSASAQPTKAPEDDAPRRLFTPAAMTQTVSDYYATMPDDTETGFELLGPTLRSQGFEAYDSFWDGIASVSVSDVRADPASRSVTATVVFVTEDGRESTELHRFGLVPNAAGDALLINTDEPIG